MSLFAKSSCPASIEYQHEIVSPEYLRLSPSGSHRLIESNNDEQMWTHWQI
jgi:hypothetical protein